MDSQPWAPATACPRRMHTCTHTHTFTHTQVHTNACIHMHTSKCMQTHVHTCIARVHAHTHTRMCAHTCVHVRTHTHFPTRRILGCFVASISKCSPVCVSAFFITFPVNCYSLWTKMHQMLSHSSYPHANLNGEIKAPAPVLYFSNALIGINKGM